jgi:branched-chain amino acid transport system ATP-binding protein
MSRALLEVHDLVAGYGDFQALFGVSLELAAGQTLAIIGSNGAGKSTLLKSLCGLVRAAPEAVRFDGQPIGGLPAREIVRRGITMVPEGRRLFPSLTVEENLLLGGHVGRPGPWTLRRVYELFPRLGERRGQRPGSMSGGEQQMVAIGRALLSNPRVLMCDELSLGLAPVVVRDIYQLLPQIARDGTALLIVEQDIRQAMSVADHAVCLLKGRVSLQGQARSLSHEQITEAYFGMAGLAEAAS